MFFGDNTHILTYLGTSFKSVNLGLCQINPLINGLKLLVVFIDSITDLCKNVITNFFQIIQRIAYL